MKFLSKVNRKYFFLLIALFLVISVVSYFVLQEIIEDEAKENLRERITEINSKISETGEMPNIYPIVQTKKVTRSEKIEKPYATVFIRHRYDDEYQKYIEYRTISKIKDNYYLITVRQSVVENMELLSTVVLSLLVILLLAFTLSYFWSKKTNEKLWKNFEVNLHKIEQFDFSDRDKIKLQDTGIEEFDKLNAIIGKLTEKLRSDYYNLKEFSENAAHELQTPLAIVSLNLEEVLQNELPASVSEKVYSAYQSVKKLSRLNQSLLLLTKIKNKQFSDTETINLSACIKRKISELSPLADSNNIKYEINVSDDFEIKANRQLIDILMNNLLSNAINHNISAGNIKITTQKEMLTICNPGDSGPLDKDTIFERFTKTDSKSHGLGLAIVKQICEVSGINIKYEYKDGNHCFTLSRAD